MDGYLLGYLDKQPSMWRERADPALIRSGFYQAWLHNSSQQRRPTLQLHGNMGQQHQVIMSRHDSNQPCNIPPLASLRPFQHVAFFDYLPALQQRRAYASTQVTTHRDPAGSHCSGCEQPLGRRYSTISKPRQTHSGAAGHAVSSTSNDKWHTSTVTPYDAMYSACYSTKQYTGSARHMPAWCNATKTAFLYVGPQSLVSRQPQGSKANPMTSNMSSRIQRLLTCRGSSPYSLVAMRRSNTGQHRTDQTQPEKQHRTEGLADFNVVVQHRSRRVGCFPTTTVLNITSQDVSGWSKRAASKRLQQESCAEAAVCKRQSMRHQQTHIHHVSTHAATQHRFGF